MNRLEEIQKRMAAIGTELEQEDSNLDELETEMNELKEERSKIQEKAEKGERNLAALYQEAKDSNKSKPEEELPSQPNSGSGTVGERKPKRDLVGINQGDE